VRPGETAAAGEKGLPWGPGERLVFFECCVSLVLVTLRRPSRPVRVRSLAGALLRGLPWTLATLLLGWWGVPWGFVYTPLALATNLSGGRALTADEWRCWREEGGRR
jgi:hypothetical protein